MICQDFFSVVPGKKSCFVYRLSIRSGLVAAQLLNKLFQPFASLYDVLIAVCKGHPDIVIALGSEHIARDHGNFGVLEQQRCKLLSGHAEFLDVDEDIECTFRAATAQTIDLIDGFNCVIAASLVFFYHVVDFLFLLAECHNTGFLNERCRTDFADIQNKKECGGNRQWQNHYLRNWAANTKGKGII